MLSLLLSSNCIIQRVKDMKRVAIVGGTKYDTNIGCALVNEMGMLGQGFPVANSAEDQERLQYFSSRELQLRVESMVQELEETLYDVLLIFCCSLSLLLDYDGLRHSTNLRIVTPVDIYPILADRFNRIFLIAANGQCLAGIEKVLLGPTGNVEVFGFANLSFVESIESGLSPEAVFHEFGFEYIVKLAERTSVECIVLACTHLSSLYAHFQDNSSIPVMDIGREMVKYLLPSYIS